jgi:hypothetical protein
VDSAAYFIYQEVAIAGPFNTRAADAVEGRASGKFRARLRASFPMAVSHMSSPTSRQPAHLTGAFPYRNGSRRRLQRDVRRQASAYGTRCSGRRKDIDVVSLAL